MYESPLAIGGLTSLVFALRGCSHIDRDAIPAFQA